MTTAKTGPTTLTVEIVSAVAAAAGAVNGMSWRGEIPLNLLDLTAEPDETQADEVNRRLRLIFDGVDEALIDSLGYRLPSLTVGDLFAWGGVTYSVRSKTRCEPLIPEAVLSAGLGPAVPAVVLRDMRAVVDYSLPAEARDYEQRPADERDGHAYERLRRIDAYLDGQGAE
jgi:hypothetical protein